VTLSSRTDEFGVRLPHLAWRWSDLDISSMQRVRSIIGRELEADLEGLKQKSVVTSQASVRLRELEREAEASRALYQSFLTRARETGEQQSIDNTNLRVISKATPPRDKSWPPRLLLIAVALVGGLGIGTGAGLMQEYFDEASTRAGR
jgi:uncharacterized protein involved in exopolysaccharide biosynthesis